ncbi:MAG: phytanoyl-CoA dioxygenase family protein [Capsulimonadales bacterium]|nr:phytanoyl-CoA dioxygenase family protein [Capsulimonadales bacterium]
MSTQSTGESRIFSPTERAAFRDEGWLVRRNYLPVEAVAAAREAVRQCAERDVGKPSERFRRREIAGLIGDEVRRAIEELVDGRPTFPLSAPQPLFTPPDAASWTVPHALWHLDLPRFSEAGLPGVQVFTFLDTVVPGGGGTLIVAGSHRLLNEPRFLRSQEAKRLLKREPYFRDLLSADSGDRSRFLAEAGRAGEVTVRVVELCGEPGDVYLTDLRLLHTIAPNASDRPRIMLTQRYLLEAFRDAVLDPAGPKTQGSDGGSPSVGPRRDTCPAAPLRVCTRAKET